MAKQRYFQWLVGERQGQVMALHHTEQESGIGYLVFSDGTRCNIALVAPLNDPNAFKQHKFMAEVYDTVNIWRFEQKRIQNDGKLCADDDGVEHEGWDPYHDKQMNGGNRPYTRIEVIPPRKTVTDAMEAMSYGRTGFIQGLMGMGESETSTMQNELRYRAEILKGKEFLDKPTVGLPTGDDMKKFGSEAGVYVPDDIFQNTGASLNENHLGVDIPEAQIPLVAQSPMATTPAVQAVLTDTPEQDGQYNNEKLYLDLTEDGFKQITDIMAKQKFTYQDKDYEIENEELLAFLEKREKDNVPSDSPALSIVKNCKKKDSKVSLELDLKIPGKNIFKIIDEEYNENVLSDFFKLVMKDIDTEVIRDALKESLITSYREAISQENA